MDDNKPVSDVLVIFDEKIIPRNILKEKQELAVTLDSGVKVKELEKELGFTRESLQNTIEELETSNEELTVH